MDDSFCVLGFLTSDNWQIYTVLFGAIITGIMVFEKIDAIRHRNKQSPPIHDVYMTKEEGAEMEARFNRSIGGLGGKMDSLQTSYQNQSNAINRTLGRLEGRNEK